MILIKIESSLMFVKRKVLHTSLLRRFFFFFILLISLFWSGVKMKVSVFALRFMIEMYHSSDEETRFAFVIDSCCLAHVKISCAVLCCACAMCRQWKHFSHTILPFSRLFECPCNLKIVIWDIVLRAKILREVVKSCLLALLHYYFLFSFLVGNERKMIFFKDSGFDQTIVVH